MKIIGHDELVNTPVVSVDFPIDKKLIADMIQTMDENNGVGLAANQVGFCQKFFIVRAKKNGPVYVVANPIIRLKSNAYCKSSEGCLSLPNEKYVVPRFTDIQLIAQDEDGKPINWFCKGRFAQIIGHEVDHLNLTTIRERAVIKKDKP